ncbi:hypothetical protein EV560_101784 [Bosea sp. BK604]|nr:hypothetical protein EV560_101784 [Bosea sp. BK604]
MDAFTMVVLACVSGQPTCTTTRVNETSFTTFEACEERIDDVTRKMTKQLGQQLELKGREVTYDVSCMNRQQLREKFGIVDAAI